MIRQRIGIIRAKNPQVNVIPSIIQKMINTTKVIVKLMRDETFLEKRKRYFGTFIFEKIIEFDISEDIPPVVASLKYENTMFPQKI